MATTDKERRRRKRKLLLPAALAVSLLGGGVSATGCGDNDTKPDTVVQRDKGPQLDTTADSRPDSPSTAFD